MRSTCSLTTAHLALVVLATCLVYLNGITGPFLYDDYFTIVSNPAIKDVRFLLDTDRLNALPLLPDLKNNIKTRTISYLTFAANYHVNNLNPVGYHLVNIVIHAVNAVLVYLLATLVISLSYRHAPGDTEASTLPSGARWQALAVALLFALHPVNTSAVTYITQRFTSLATLLYLLALLTYIKGRCADSSPSMAAYLLVSLAATGLAMDTKEISFTIPVMMTMVELLFLKGRASRRLVTIIPFYLTMLIIPLTLWSLVPSGSGLVNEFTESTNVMNLGNISRASYLFTQFRVIVTYLRIMVFPVGLNFDYDYPVFDTFLVPPVFLSFIGLVCFFLFGVYLLLRSRNPDDPDRVNFRVSAFGIFWFFLTLSMSSSIIPINDVINEYRLYLPSIGFFLFAVGGVSALLPSLSRGSEPVFRKSMMLGGVVLVGVLATATVMRNRVWQDTLVFWGDAVDKSPNKLRPSQVLANEYQARNLPDEAVYVLTALIKRNPLPGKPHFLLGSLFLRQGRFLDAEREFKKALSVRDDKAMVQVGLAKAYLGQGKVQTARDSLVSVMLLDPGHVEIPALREMIILLGQGLHTGVDAGACIPGAAGVGPASRSTGPENEVRS